MSRKRPSGRPSRPASPPHPRQAPGRAHAARRRPARPRAVARRRGGGGRGRTLRRLLLGLLVVPLLLAAFLGALAFVYVFNSVPLPGDIGTGATVVVDQRGEEIGTLEPHAGQREIPLDEVPEHVRAAVLAAEDAQFYEHSGVSFAGLARATLVNVLRGEAVQGGSTISQQYIKNVTADDDRTVVRKVREAALAMKLERQFSKDQILEFYLNSIYFGRGAHGIEAAAQAYYAKPAAELTPAEGALLAGLLPAPSRYDPDNDPGAARRRYDYVVGRLADEGVISAAEAGEMSARLPPTEPPRRLAGSKAPYFMDAVREDLGRVLGSEGAAYRGLEVVTTLDLGVQAAAQRAYDEHLAGVEPASALVALDPGSGGIRALIGGKDRAADEYNAALRARRQVGSAFKPFTLAAWIEQGRSPETYYDGPAELEMPDPGAGGTWRLSNYGGQAFGEISLREATWQSVNTVYAQVSEDVGLEPQIDIAERAGIPPRRLEPVPSLVLGSQSVTPLELAEAYNTFAAGGVHHRAIAVTEVRRGDGVIYRANVREERAFSEQVAWTVTDVLRGVITHGTGTAADIGRPAAGKTGTTNNSADAWFAGYTPHLTAVVWMGNRDSNQSMEGDPTGGGLPAQVWAAFMGDVLSGIPAADFPEPSGDLDVVRHSPTPTEPTPTEPTPTEPSPTEPSPTEPTPTETEEPDPTPTGDPEPTGDPDPSPDPEPTGDPDPTPDPEPTQSDPTTPPPDPSPTPTGDEGGGGNGEGGNGEGRGGNGDGEDGGGEDGGGGEGGEAAG